MEEQKINGDFANIGGVRGKNSRFFLPTGQIALFLIGDDDFNRRLQVQQLFGAEHIFWEKKIVWLEDMQNGEPAMHGRLIQRLITSIYSHMEFINHRNSVSIFRRKKLHEQKMISAKPRLSMI